MLFVGVIHCCAGYNRAIKLINVLQTTSEIQFNVLRCNVVPHSRFALHVSVVPRRKTDGCKVFIVFNFAGFLGCIKLCCKIRTLYLQDYQNEKGIVFDVP